MIPAISGAIGPLGAGEWSVSGLGGSAALDATGTTSAAGDLAGVSGTNGTTFQGALTNAISALEQTQATATDAAQALATGKATDPTQAVTAVENASLEMQLAAQIRTKAVEAANDIFHTQI